MKLTVFQSDKGDCLLVTSKDGKRVLVDGGMPESYTAHVAPFLNKLREDGEKLDVVYVSHTDADHIAGILQMMDDKVDWAVYEYKESQGIKRNQKPKSIRTPEIGEIWHNAFDEQVGGTGDNFALENALKIENALAASSAVLYGSNINEIRELAENYQELATSVKQAISLSRRLSRKQLNIPLNPSVNGNLMMFNENGDNPPIKVGKTNWQILAPFKEDLKEYEKEWDEWLKKNQATLRKMDVKTEKDERDFGNRSANREITRLIASADDQAEALYQKIESDNKELESSDDAKKIKNLGRRKNVTAPNLASLMFLVEEETNGDESIKTILLTGDGHSDEILKGLEKTGKLDKNGCLHVDILKVQHHGAEFNIDAEFCKKITADHYVFCGNGGHENPEVVVVETIIDSRLTKELRSEHPSAASQFKFWFNCHPENFESDKISKTDKKSQENMQRVLDKVEICADKSNGKLKYEFLKTSYFEIQI